MVVILFKGLSEGIPWTFGELDSGSDKLLRDRLEARRLVLAQVTGVRLPVPQQKSSSISGGLFLLHEVHEEHEVNKSEYRISCRRHPFGKIRNKFQYRKYYIISVPSVSSQCSLWFSFNSHFCRRILSE
jgi:hypothetical protein